MHICTYVCMYVCMYVEEANLNIGNPSRVRDRIGQILGFSLSHKQALSILLYLSRDIWNGKLFHFVSKNQIREKCVQSWKLVLHTYMLGAGNVIKALHLNTNTKGYTSRIHSQKMSILLIHQGPKCKTLSLSKTH